MALPLLPLAIGLATEFLPDVVGWFAGDDAEQKAEEFMGMAQQAAGVETPQEVHGAFAQNPELVLKFQSAFYKFQSEMYREDTKRLESVNQTMRVEYETKDNFRGRWRAWWGWVSGTAFGIQILSIQFIGGWAVIDRPEQAATIIDSMAKLAGALTATWAIALTVLGVAVAKRSGDKRAAAGVTPPGMIQQLSGLFKGRA